MKKQERGWKKITERSRVFQCVLSLLLVTTEHATSELISFFLVKSPNSPVVRFVQIYIVNALFGSLKPITSKLGMSVSPNDASCEM